MPRNLDNPESRAKYNAYMKQYRQSHTSWKRISVSLSGEEYMKLKVLSEEQGGSLSACFKGLAMAQLRKNENYPETVKQEFIQFVQTMRGIGNNINQIARHSNKFREFILREELHQQFKALEQNTQTFLSSSHK